MNKKTKKVLSLALAAVLLVCTTVAATVAYLTDDTGVVKNTFTVGKVTIELDELPVDLYGVPSTKSGEGENVTWTAIPEEQIDTFEEAANYTGRVTENEYKLIPGHEYTKDPMVHVVKGSEECWLFVKVENGIKDIEAETTISAQMAANNWTLVNGETNVYAYANKVDARDAKQSIPVFGEFTLKTDAVVEGYETAVITIDAYAVQADGFATAQIAWDTAEANWANN